LFFLLLGSLMIGLSCLPQSLSAQSGETSYQQKCAACHTIGGGRLVGPDLKGVISKRDPSWLIRWIREPDKMLAEGDPIATQQLQEYNGVPMPNLGVSETEAKNIIAYIEKVESSSGQPTPVEETAPVVASSSPAGNIANGKQAYQKCAVCHTIGGKGEVGTGPGEVGPDLKGVTSRRELTWLVRWIQEPNKMLDEGDPIATQLLEEHNNVRMPNWGLSETEARDILAYLAAESGDGPIAVEPSKPVVPTAPAGDPEIGRALFIGEQSFANGGPACIACHTTSDVSGLGGGTLGPDLTKAHSRFGGDIGLNSILVSLPYPTMQGVFSKKPVKKDEAAHLTAYFAETNSLTEKPSMDFTISMISIGGFIILYLLTHFIWRKRLTGVRIPLVGR
jgi:mono/diheme cytochrome c family protein